MNAVGLPRALLLVLLAGVGLSVLTAWSLLRSNKPQEVGAAPVRCARGSTAKGYPRSLGVAR
jgi:hypothetical protein